MSLLRSLFPGLYADAKSEAAEEIHRQIRAGVYGRLTPEAYRGVRILTAWNYIYYLDAPDKYIPIIGWDFDGVFTDYKGWRGVVEHFPPLKNVDKMLNHSRRLGYRNVIVTARTDFEDTIDWLFEHELAHFVDAITNFKIPAFHYIDDRSYRFEGDVEAVISYLDADTQPWWKNNGSPQEEIGL